MESLNTEKRVERNWHESSEFMDGLFSWNGIMEEEGQEKEE
jgi:hypothetical protein